MKSPTRFRSELTFGSLLVYAPQGTTDESRRSQQVARHIKNCRNRYIEHVGLRFAQAFGNDEFHDFLGPDVILVPAPRSTPTVKDMLWPALQICRELKDRGLCDRVDRALERQTAVNKSALAGKGSERPSPEQHRDSLRCLSHADAASPLLPLPKKITIVDDVVTRGSTMLGCAWALEERFADVAIRGLAVIRTMSRQEIPKILAPVETGRIYLAGKAPRREP